MIVFWRLFLAYFLTDFIFAFEPAEAFCRQNKAKRIALHGGVFLIIALLLCHGYLTMNWPFLEMIDLPGWLVIILFALFYTFTEGFFDFGGKIKHGYFLSFFSKTFVNMLFLFLCVPFHVLYETGHFFAERWIVFCAGLLLATRVVGWCIFTIEQDRYGRDYPTFDEQWLLMMARAIFFLIMLLPGWRWIVLLFVWLGTCIYARKIRLLDVSSFAFYCGVFGAVFLGFLVRLRFYLVW